MAEEAKWYVVHTYSGYENKVKANIEKSVDNRGISNLIQSVEVPMNEVVEEKDGKEKVVNKKIYPGYVIIKMIMNDESWFVVRNTRGVTGFVGPGSKPVPLTDLEVKNMGVEKSGDSGMKFSVGTVFASNQVLWRAFRVLLKRLTRKQERFLSWFPCSAGKHLLTLK